MTKTTSKTTSSKQPYLTKKVLNRAVNSGVKKASRKAMTTAGSVVVVKGDWVVRRYDDGRFTEIKKLDLISKAKVKKKLAKLATR